MAKQKKVKWALGGSEPEDLQEFKDNEQIVKENGGLPTKGVYRLRIQQITVKPNKNNDDRLGVMLVMDAPKKDKAASYNGYVAWDGFNVNEQGAPFIKRWLKGLGLKWSDFIENTVQDDQDPPHITSIGKVRFDGPKPVYVRAMLRQKPADDFNDEDYMNPSRYLPADSVAAVEPEGAGDEAVDMSADEVKPVKAKKAKKSKKADDGDPNGLDALDHDALVARCKGNGNKGKALKELDDDGLRELIRKDENLPPF